MSRSPPALGAYKIFAPLVTYNYHYNWSVHPPAGMVAGFINKKNSGFSFATMNTSAE